MAEIWDRYRLYTEDSDYPASMVWLEAYFGQNREQKLVGLISFKIHYTSKDYMPTPQNGADSKPKHLKSHSMLILLTHTYIPLNIPYSYGVCNKIN